ncbi:MAG: putative lipid II flippase FtsW [Thermodesulfobacteriota bacterium]
MDEHRGHFDFLLLSLVMALVSIGIVMVYSASFVVAGQKFGDNYHFLKKQAIAAGLGFFLLFLAARIDYHRWQKLAWLLVLLSIILLAFLILPVPGLRREAGAPARWLRFFSFSFQPAELAKFSLVVYMARSLVKKGETVQNFMPGLLPHFIILAVFFGLVFKQPDFGTGVIFCMLVFIMLFVGGARILHLGGIILTALPMFLFLALQANYRKERLLAFLNPWQDPGNTGFQIIQSFLAFGAGKIWGLGLGEGRQKLFYLPEMHTDFIFSVIGEELGLIGVAAVISLFFFLTFRGWQISLRAPDLFGRYLGIGLVSMMAGQALMNMGVVLGLLPTKGSPLPFLSYGGTSLIINLMAMGILENISSQGLRKVRENNDRRRGDGRTSLSRPGRS